MALDFLTETFVDLTRLGRGEKSKPAGIPTSEKLTGIELRLSRVAIINNKTPKLGPFPGYSKMYMIIIVVSDSGEVIENIDLKSFAKVDDGEDLPVDKTIYYWKQKSKKDKAPSHIHVLVSVIKSKQGLRDVSIVLADAKKHPDYSKAVTKLKNVVKGGQQINEVSALLFQLANIVGKFLGAVEDKTLMTWVQSFSDIYGDWDQLGKTIRKRENKYVEINLSLTIRDAEREKKAGVMPALKASENT